MLTRSGFGTIHWEAMNQSSGLTAPSRGDWSFSVKKEQFSAAEQSLRLLTSAFSKRASSNHDHGSMRRCFH